MRLRFLSTTFLLCLLTSCAERQIDIMDKDGNVVGGCIAGYDWHLYGLQDSIDYMLYQCAKESIAMGYSITDNSLLKKDFSLPKPPEGQYWNKQLAMEHFKRGNISERKLGYILAEIEYKYRRTIMAAEEALSSGEIGRDKFEQISLEAKTEWLGK